MLRVSKEWAAAVHSMHPLDAELPDTSDEATVLHLCQSSPVARHIGTVDLHRFQLSAWPLYIFALRLPNLRSLAYALEKSWAALVFPARLRTLDIQFVSHADATGERAAIELNIAIAVIAALPLLESLSLSADGLASSCCLTPLIAAAALRSLTLQLDEHVIGKRCVTRSDGCAAPHDPPALIEF
jgi:hypothetical protein